MVYSMTGYGRETLHTHSTTIIVEVRSINSRYLDISVTLPQSFLFLEEEMKKTVRSYFARGRLEVYVQFSGDQLSEKILKVDWELLAEYVKLQEKAQEKFSLRDDFSVSQALMIPEVMTVVESEKQDEELTEALLRGLKSACKQVHQARKLEADTLMIDVEERLQQIEDKLLVIEQEKDAVNIAYQKRISERIDQFTANEMVDESRLHQEIAHLLERGDITEEINRLKSHLDHFRHIIIEEQNIGRKLDFVIQEMHREINTIGSKALDGELGKKVIFMKSESEKIREQIQNIE